MTEQLSLFTLDSASPQIDIPKKWERSYKGWTGTFEIVRSRQVGKSKLKNYDVAIDIFDSDGDWQTLVEITTPLISSAEEEFRDTVDRLSFKTNKRKIPLTDLGSLLSPSLSASPVSESSDEYKSVLVSPVSESTFKGNDSLTTTWPQDSDFDSLTGVNIYKPAGSARGDLKYFRYTYREANKTKHLHIPGGNTAKNKAQYNAETIRRVIAGGASQSEIKQIIRQMR